MHGNNASTSENTFLSRAYDLKCDAINQVFQFINQIKQMHAEEQQVIRMIRRKKDPMIEREKQKINMKFLMRVQK